MSSSSIELGKAGEAFAGKYYKENKYEIREKNFRCSLGEIDLILKKGERYIFVEIKTRRSTKYGNPEEAVNVYKKEKIFKTALLYLKKIKKPDAAMEFRVLSILWPEGEEPIVKEKIFGKEG